MPLDKAKRYSACALLMEDRLKLPGWFPNRQIEWRNGAWRYVNQ